MDPRLALVGLLGGFAVGLTGMGGGAILTPILVLVLRVPAAAAVGSDLAASLAMKPVAGGVHARAGTVRWDIVGWLCAGSVPGAVVGATVSARLAAHQLERVMAVALLMAATAMIVSGIQRSRNRAAAPAALMPEPVRPLPTLLIGALGGTMVGITSVGSGSLMIVALTLLYPSLPTAVLVGTDLAQAIPLVGAATLAHLLVGEIRFGVTGLLLIGALPGAYLGARLSSRPANRFVRPALVTLLFASGLRLLTA